MTAKKISRFILGVILPVPLFVLLFYGSYLYKSYHGYDPETEQYILGASNLEASRSHAQTELMIFIVYGYFIMGIPSVIYSILLELQRSKKQFNLRTYLGIGAFMGFLNSFIFLLFLGTFTASLYQIGYAIFSSTLVGLIASSLLLSIKGDNYTNKANKTLHTTASS